ncbi:hypothetical protein BCR34DRAFT_646425, partial [Clohesyomyces aquaticus]
GVGEFLRANNPLGAVRLELEKTQRRGKQLASSHHLERRLAGDTPGRCKSTGGAKAGGERLELRPAIATMLHLQQRAQRRKREERVQHSRAVTMSRNGNERQWQKAFIHLGHNERRCKQIPEAGTRNPSNQARDAAHQRSQRGPSPSMAWGLAPLVRHFLAMHDQACSAGAFAPELQNEVYFIRRVWTPVPITSCRLGRGEILCFSSPVFLSTLPTSSRATCSNRSPAVTVQRRAFVVEGAFASGHRVVR